MLRPAWAVVDLDALARNFDRLRGRIGDAGVLAVLKADAYGHGATVVGRFLERTGVDRLGVALLEEGAELRRAGVGLPILVLGTARPEQLPLYRRYGLTPTISNADQLEMWRSWVGRSASGSSDGLPVHLKVDVGMNRLGLAPEELDHALRVVRETPGLLLDGLLSHLADADLLDSPRTADQEERFAGLLELLTPDERERIALHLANSAGAIHHAGTRHGFVRSGLALFGLDPAGRTADFEPVMSVNTRVVQVKRVPPGARVGYGGTWTARRETRLGVIPVGYADGYGWRLSNRAEVLISGRRAPVVGSVSMDMTLIDVTDIPLEVGQRVTILGRDGEAEISARNLADWADTIPYEILCLLGLRLPREYRLDGAAVAFESRLAVES